MTKFIALAAAALVGTASVAMADSSFSYQDTLADSPILDLGVVTSDGAGVVEVYDFRGGEIGALLGSERVAAGANADVRVNVNMAPTAGVIAVLKVDGQTLAQRDYDISQN